MFEGNPPKKWTLVAREATDVGSPPALSREDPFAVADGDAAENGNEGVGNKEVGSLPAPSREDWHDGRRVIVEVEVHRSDEADGASEHPTSKPTMNEVGVCGVVRPDVGDEIGVMENSTRSPSSTEVLNEEVVSPVSYTHLTLPTILRV